MAERPSVQNAEPEGDSIIWPGRSADPEKNAFPGRRPWVHAMSARKEEGNTR